MRFLKSGPDLPDRLIQAHEDGNVVFFCGAGISYPAGLNSFGWLTTKIFSLCGESPDALETIAIDEKRFDTALDLLEHRISDRIFLRGKLADALRPDLRKKNAKATHKALLTLAKGRSGNVRLVTTNFDRLFFSVAKSHAYFSAPMVPIPKKWSWDGIVYLHGLLPTDKSDAALNRLVVTSGDFGLAYLTERWASRFVSELFKTYTVCFVGYSIDDPVLRYMMDALAADRLLGETLPEAFAFASYEEGAAAETEQVWRAKRVTPIPYSAINGHEALHGSLRAWAATYRDGLGSKTAIIMREASSPPSKIRDDGNVGRVLWALHDPSGVPAKVFSELDPVPPIAWLTALADTELPIISRQVRPNQLDDEAVVDLPKYNYLYRLPSQLSQTPMALVHPMNRHAGAWQVDETMHYIIRWLGRHLSTPELIGWVVERGGGLHDHLRTEIQRRLREEVLPVPVRKIWSVYCADLVGDTHGSRGDVFGWPKRFKVYGLVPDLHIELRQYLQPIVKFRKPFRWDGNEFGDEVVSGKQEYRSVSDYARWEIAVRAGDHLEHIFSELAKLPSWNAALVQLLPTLTRCLSDAMELAAYLDEPSYRQDGSYSSRPSITDHEQNKEFRSWTIIVTLLRDALMAAALLSPTLARLEVVRWKTQSFPIFKRFLLFASTLSQLQSISTSTQNLLSDGGWWLWSPECQRETFRLLHHLAPKVKGKNRSAILNQILRGPPRKMFRKTLQKEEWNRIVVRNQWLRLARLGRSGLVLKGKAELLLNKISINHPNWRLHDDEREEFPVWMSSVSGGDVGNSVVLPRSPKALARRLEKRRDQDHFYSDDWRAICKHEPQIAIGALAIMAGSGMWVESVWREALQEFSENSKLKVSWAKFPAFLAKMPDDRFQLLLQQIGWWLKSVSSVPGIGKSKYLLLCNRVLISFGGEGEKGGDRDDDPVSAAINHPIGYVTQGLLTIWYAGKPTTGQTISREFSRVFTRICDVSVKEFVHGRILLAGALHSLYIVDPAWTRTTLIPLLQWHASLAEARSVWLGYLRSPRISDDFLLEIKKAFLETAAHRSLLGEYGSQYVALLAWVAINKRDPYFKVTELRDAMNKLPATDLAVAAQNAENILISTGDQREECWLNRIGPFFSDIWPKSSDRKTPAASQHLAEICSHAGSRFPDAVAQLVPLMVRSKELYLVSKALLTNGHGKTFPTEVLTLLDAFVDTTYQWPPTELKTLMEEIQAVDRKAKTKSNFIRLSNYLTRFEAGVH